ncbi:MAG: dihydrolipoyl dehydrogenase [Candidatus Binatia bacterium]
MPDKQQRYDVVVIGAGPGGYTAALRAAEHGLSVAVVERDRLGGVCANQGCIPTKALLRSAEVFALVRDAAAFGVTTGEVGFDLGAVVDRAVKTAASMEKGVEALLRGAKIPVIRGDGRLAGGGRVVVRTSDGETTLAATHVVLATGARPRTPAGFESDGRLVWTYRDALVPAQMPRSILVMGAGAIGVELASFYRTLGADVTMVEMQSRILATEDAEISEAMQRAMKRQGVRILTGAKATRMDKRADAVTVTVEVRGNAETITADRLLVATGIDANTENLGLDCTAVRMDRGHIVVDGWLATSEPGLYAIGDLTGPPWLAHKASREALICIDRIAATEIRDRYGFPAKSVPVPDFRELPRAGTRVAVPLRRGAVPACTYATPQVASVGVSEGDAVAGGRRVRCGRSTFLGNGKARALGSADGFVKTVFDADTGELLGAHMIGPEVTEFIGTFALALTLEATEAEILATVFPHPTLSEAVHEATAAAFSSEIVSHVQVPAGRR